MRLDRRERIRLLLASYLDACSPGRTQSDIRAALGSRPPPRAELFDEGSYHELGQALDKIKTPCPKIYRHTIAYYVETREPWSQKRVAERGVSLLERLMPRNIFVPEDVAIRAGVTPGDARAASKWKRQAA